MYVWKTRDSGAFCVPEAKSGTTQPPAKTTVRQLLTGGCASAAGSAFPVNRYGVFPFRKIRRICYVITIP